MLYLNFKLLKLTFIHHQVYTNPSFLRLSYAVLLHYLQLFLHEFLSSFPIAVYCKCTQSSKEGQDFHCLSSAELSQTFPPVTAVFNVLDHHYASNVAYEGPSESCPNHVSLDLHELQVSLVSQSVKSYLRLVFVFLLELLELLLALCLMLQVWIIKGVRAFSLSDFDPLSFFFKLLFQSFFINV